MSGEAQPLYEQEQFPFDDPMAGFGRPRKLVKVECETCGAAIYLTPSRIRASITKRFYCNHKHRAANEIYRRIKSLQQTERSASGQYFTLEARVRMSHSAAARHQRSHFKRSSQELLLEELLQRWGIRHTPQKHLRSPEDYPEDFSIVVDFWIPELGPAGGVAECQGTYWKSDPRRYPNREALNEVQLLNLERFSRKQRLLESMDIPLWELWELDANAGRAEELIVFPLVAEIVCLEALDLDELEVALTSGAGSSFGESLQSL